MAKILVVEDVKDHRRLICNVLQSGGHEPLGAANGQEAIEILRRDGTEIDLMTLDYSMPGMSGMELLDRLHSGPMKEDVHENGDEEFKLLVVAITVYTTDDDAIQMRKEADGFVAKPFGHKELLKTVKAVLKKKGERSK